MTDKQQFMLKSGLCECGAIKDDNERRCKKCKEKRSIRYRKRREQEVASIGNTHTTRWATQNRYLVLLHYSNNTMKCACCGEDNIYFLTIDHINGDGNKHRASVLPMGGKVFASTSGREFYTWLLRNNYPPGFQVLCWNCNCGKRGKGICPHKLPKVTLEDVHKLLSKRKSGIGVKNVTLH